MHHPIPPRFLARGLVVTAFCLVLNSANAGTLYLSRLSAANENPPTASTSTGTGVLILNDAETVATITATHDISLPVTGGHIHRGLASANGPVIFPFPAPTSPVGPLTWNISTANVDNLKNEGLYMNFHTGVNPGGAIRGQLRRALLGPAATTAAQLRLANVLDISAGYAADLDQILVATNLASTTVQAQTLGELAAGTIYAPAQEEIETMASLTDGVFAYFDETRDRPASGATHNFNGFIRGGRAFGHRSATANQQGTDISRPFVLAGLDFQMGPNSHAGLAAGYANARDTFKNSAGRTNTKTTALNGFASFALGNSGISIDGSAGYGSSKISSTRTLATLGRTATASVDGKVWSGALRASMAVGSSTQTSIRPYALIDVQKATVDGYTESGAGAANLIVPQRVMWNAALEAGATFTVPIKVDAGTMTIRLQAGWRHMIEEGASSISTWLSGSPLGFTTQFDGVGKNSARVEAALAFPIGHDAEASLGYRGLLGSSSQRVHALEATINIRL